MSYVPHFVTLSIPHAGTLAKGGSIVLPVKSFTGPHKVHLTRTQLQGMQKAAMTGKRMKLKMSDAQLRHHVKHGSGFFSDIIAKVRHFVGRPETKAAVKKALGAVIRRASNHLGNRYLSGQGNMVEGHVDRALKSVGMGFHYPKMTLGPKMNIGMSPGPVTLVGKGVRRRRMKGGNIFDSIGNFFKKPSNILGGLGTIARFTPFAPFSAPLAAASLGTKLLGAGLKKGKKRKLGVKRKLGLKRKLGGSFLLSGSG